MSALTSLTERLNQVFQSADQRKQEFHQQAHDRLQVMQERYATFEKLRTHLREDIAIPRLDSLIERFDHVEVTPETNHDGGQCLLNFLHTPDAPARVKLLFRLSHDEEVQNLFLDYDLEILPIFVKFQPHYRLSVNIENPSDDEVVQWLDDRIVEFVDIYLKLQFVDQYQQAHLVSDPVLQMRFPKSFAAGEADLNGVTYYFATDESKKLFEADPTKFIQLKA